jgi:hypothetical protein
MRPGTLPDSRRSIGRRCPLVHPFRAPAVDIDVDVHVDLDVVVDAFPPRFLPLPPAPG